MAIILRVDVDSPYGKKNFLNHVFSRLTSDYDLPIFPFLPYLRDLTLFIEYLNNKKVKGYFFFRKCTIPSYDLLKKLEEGNHKIGLHLENSRSLENFRKELEFLENKLNIKIKAFSKHGSGKKKYGKYHYAPYEPEKYLKWAKELNLKIFFGNYENPELKPLIYEDAVLYFPSAYWLEPFWRDTKKFDHHWLMKNSLERDIVLLLHAENIIYNKVLFSEFNEIINSLPFKVLSEYE